MADFSDVMMDQDSLKIIRETFSEATALEVEKSWDRCRRYGVPEKCDYPRHVLDERELAQLQNRNSELIHISSSMIETISTFAEQSHFIIALADRYGILLKITGNERMKESVCQGGFIEGADWSERSAGSNAVGTALAIGRPIQFNGSEHYCSFTRKTSGAGAPIRDSSGVVIGIAVLVGRLRDVNDHTLGMTIAMAAAIENMLRISYEHERTLISEAYKNTIMESISQGVIALDKNSRITHINHVAADLISVDKNVTGRSLVDALGEGNREIIRLLSRDRDCFDHEIPVRTRNGEVHLNITMQQMLNGSGERIGTVLVLDEPRRVKRLASRYSGLTARLTFSDLIGVDPVFLDRIRLAKAAAKKDTSILLLGESGTGKDMLAQAIHNASGRRNGPFVAINCGAIPKELVASTLFGYVDGAFTGARKGGSIGQFQMADGGTIFLDEIGEMSADIQVHLLRVLENHVVTRVGDTEAVPVDVRVIAATNRDLKASVEKGYFREDLYYRLNVISLRLPPLRERKSDIPLLTRHIFSQLNPLGAEPPEEYEEVLRGYSWPGNIRELRNIIERTCSLSPDGNLDISFLPPELKEAGTVKTKTATSVKVSDMEKDALVMLMERYDGNITQVAKELGVARSTVYRKMKKYHLIDDR